MFRPYHADFAAVALISENMVNRCLNTYVATFLDNQHANWSWVAPAAVNGARFTLDITADGLLISLKASLHKNAFGQVAFTAVFYGTASLNAYNNVFRNGVAVESHTAEALIQVSFTASLIAQTVGDQFQFGVNLQNSHINLIQAQVFSPDLPPNFAKALKDGLEAPLTRRVLDAFLHNVAPAQLRATSTMVPAFYNYSMDRSKMPGQKWFNVHVPAGRLVWIPLEGCLIAAIDVAGYTSGSVADLRDFRQEESPPDATLAQRDVYHNADIATSTNLGFVQDFIVREVIPVMRDGFLLGNLRLNQINRFEIKPIGTMVGKRPGLEIELSMSYWDMTLAHAAFSDSTRNDITVTINGFPYVRQKALLFEVAHVNVKLPSWLDVALIVAAFILPPISFLIPFIFQDIMHDAIADAINMLNGMAAANGLDLTQSFTLPATRAPRWQPDPLRFGFFAYDTHKESYLFANVKPAEDTEVKFYVQTGPNPVEVPANNFSISLQWELPAIISAFITVPPGVYEPHDPTLRVRWQTFLNGKPVAMATKDRPFRENLADHLQVSVYRFMNPKTPDQEIKITVRFFRQIGALTEDIMNDTASVLSFDPRPYWVKPYVQWAHNVKYWDGFKNVARRRLSKIHKAPGKGGCRFSNQYLNLQVHDKWKFYSIRHFTGLPFEMRDIAQNRDIVCPYCFFGGPDKNPHAPWNGTVDMTGVVAKKIRAAALARKP